MRHGPWPIVHAPKEWAGDEASRREGGLSDGIDFKTKPDITPWAKCAGAVRPACRAGRAARC